MQELKQNWRDIFRGFRLGLDIWKICLAFFGLVASVAGIAILLQLQQAADWIPLAIAALAVWVLLLVNALRSDDKVSTKKLIALGVLLLVFAGLVWLLSAADLSEAAVSRVGSIVLLTLIWAFFGGAIARSAVVELATDERLGMWEALQYACGRYRHYVWSILAPIVGILFFLLIMALGGLVAQVPVLDILVSLTTPLYLLAGFIVMLIVVGLVAGWPLMFPAVSAEGSDSFDAISRAYSYIYTKPWKYVWYHLVALAYAGVVIFFVKLFALGLVCSIDKSLEFGMHDDYTDHVRTGVVNYGVVAYEPVQIAASKAVSVVRHYDVTGGLASRFVKVAYSLPVLQSSKVDVGWSQGVVVFVAGIGFIVFILVVVSFAISLGFSLQSIIYLLMRKDVDGTDMTEVFQEEEEEDYLAAVAVPEEEKKEEEPEEKAEEAEAPAQEPEAEKPEKPKRKTTRKRTPRKKKTEEGEKEESE